MASSDAPGRCRHTDHIEREHMTAKAGEIARENATYSCQNCGGNVAVHNGKPIQDCPECGHESFITGARTLNNQTAAASPFDGFGTFQ